MNAVSIKNLAIDLALSNQVVLEGTNQCLGTKYKSVLKQISDEDAAKVYDYMIKNTFLKVPKQKRKYTKRSISKKAIVRKQADIVTEKPQVVVINPNENLLARLFRI